MVGRNTEEEDLLNAPTGAFGLEVLSQSPAAIAAEMVNVAAAANFQLLWCN
jgi:hypothetical protein